MIRVESLLDGARTVGKEGEGLPNFYNSTGLAHLYLIVVITNIHRPGPRFVQPRFFSREI